MIKKILGLAFLIFVCVLRANGQCTGSSPTWTVTLVNNGTTDATAWQSCITSASSGDTINVVGTTTLNPGTGNSNTGVVNVPSSKYVTINGGGTAIVNFTNVDPGVQNPSISINASTSGSSVLTGFTFNGGQLNGRGAVAFITAFSPVTKAFRFYNNTVNENAGLNLTFANTWGNGPGLVDHNTFTGNTIIAAFFQNFGEGTPAPQTSWSEDVVPGGPTFLFFENNLINGVASTNSSGSSLAQDFGGVRLVIRSNTFNNANLDFHGYNVLVQPPTQPNSCDYVNTRWWEIYNNSFNIVGPASIFSWADMRGGSGVIFNNTLSGTNASSGIMRMVSDCQTISFPYPAQDQIGQGITVSNGSAATHSSPAYVWNNAPAVGTRSPDSFFVQQGRDFFVSTTQPSPMTKCESAADVATGCPVSYQYAPYQYPHPQDNCPTSVIGVASGSSCTGGGAGNPILSFTPATPNFGTVNLGQNTQLAITVTNSGTGSETLSNPYYSITGTNSADYTNVTVPSPQLVQHTSFDAGVGTTGSGAFISNNIAGDWIGVVIRIGAVSPTIGVTDSKGNTYHNAVQYAQTADGHTDAIFYAENIGAGANTVTVTSSASATIRFAIVEFSGIVTSGSLDGTPVSAQANSVSPSSGTATPSQNWDLVLGGISTGSAAQTFTPTNNFSLLDAPANKLMDEYQFLKTAGPIAATATLGVADNWAAGMAFFKAANTTGGNGCINGGTIAANGGTCSVSILFTPGAAGTRTATLNIAGTVGASVNLTGVGQSATTIPSTPTNLTVTGSGGAGAPINLNWTASIGTGPITYNCLVSIPSQGIGGPYTAFATATGGSTSCPNFIPGHTGVYYFEVSATNSAGTSAATAPVAFTVNVATSPAENLNPSTLTFLNIPLSSTSGSQPVVLTNVGTATLTVSSITISGSNAADFAVSSTVPASTCGGSLAPSAACTINVTFTPSTILPVQEVASLVVATNDPVNPSGTVSLTGNGVGQVVVTPTSINFGNQFVSKTSGTQTVTFQNNSGVAVVFTSVALATGTQFSISSPLVNTCSGTLAIASSCTTQVNFTPTSTGTKTDTLTFSFTGPPGSPIAVALSGSGRKHGVLRVGAAVDYRYTGKNKIKNIIYIGCECDRPRRPVWY
jgi:hypothetical protein